MPQPNLPISLLGLGSTEQIHETYPLTAGQTYTSPWIDVSKCAMFTVMLFADQPSAANGVQFQWSCDQTETGYLSDDHNLVANAARAFALTPRSVYFRLKYTNSGTNQIIWRCCIHTHMGGAGLITRPLSKNLDDNNFAQTVRSVIDGQKSNGTFEHLKTDDSGALKVSVAAGGAPQDIHVVDDNGLNMDVVRDSAYIANTRALLIAGIDQSSSLVRIPTVSRDSVDNKDRIEVTGKISISAPPPPPTATAVVIDASSPLSVGGTSEITEYVIPDGDTFNLSSITVGTEGDPNERGSRVDVDYIDSSSVAHIVERVYISGFTIQIFPNTKEARDGTDMVGNGTTTKIRITRSRLGGGTVQLDVVARGFVE